MTPLVLTEAVLGTFDSGSVIKFDFQLQIGSKTGFLSGKDLN